MTHDAGDDDAGRWRSLDVGLPMNRRSRSFHRSFVSLLWPWVVGADLADDWMLFGFGLVVLRGTLGARALRAHIFRWASFLRDFSLSRISF